MSNDKYLQTVQLTASRIWSPDPRSAACWCSLHGSSPRRSSSSPGSASWAQAMPERQAYMALRRRPRRAAAAGDRAGDRRRARLAARLPDPAGRLPAGRVQHRHRIDLPHRRGPDAADHADEESRDGRRTAGVHGIRRRPARALDGRASGRRTACELEPPRHKNQRDLLKEK